MKVRLSDFSHKLPGTTRLTVENEARSEHIDKGLHRHIGQGRYGNPSADGQPQRMAVFLPASLTYQKHDAKRHRQYDTVEGPGKYKNP